MSKALQSDDVVDFLENNQILSEVDPNNVSYMVRYVSDKSLIIHEILYDVNWDRRIKDFVIDYGDEKCFIWRKGIWRNVDIEPYRRKSNYSYSGQFNQSSSGTYRRNQSEEDYDHYWQFSDINESVSFETRKISINKFDNSELDAGVELGKILVKTKIGEYALSHKNTNLKIEHDGQHKENGMCQINFSDKHKFFHISLAHAYASSLAGNLLDSFIKIDYECRGRFTTIYKLSEINGLKSEVTWAKVYFKPGVLYFSKGRWYLCGINHVV